MTVLGGAVLALSIWGAYLYARKKLVNSKLYLRLMIIAISFPFIGNSAGWIMTEIGRQPWVVFGYMKTEDAVSAGVTAGEVLFSLITFSALYLILFAVMITLFVREIKKGPEHDIEKSDPIADPFTKEGQHAFS